MKNTVKISSPSKIFHNDEILHHIYSDSLKLFLWLYEVGIDVHEKHVITWEDNFIMTRASKNQVLATDYSLPEEIFVIDDDHNSNSLTTSGKHYNLRRSEAAAASL